MREFLLAFSCFLLLGIPSVLLLAPILCICEIFRQFFTICLSIKHRQWIQLVSNSNTIYLLQKDMPGLILNYFMIFQGSLDLAQMKETIKSKWTDVKKNLRLRQHVVDSCGYFYWLPDNIFTIDNHVKIYKCKPPTNQNELDDIFSEISSQLLAENISQWLVLLFPLDDAFANEPRYVMLFRFHHCLGDGYNSTRMLNHCFLNEKCIKYLPAKTEKSFSFSALLIGFFYHFKYIVDTLLTKDCNILKGPSQTSKRYLTYFIVCSLSRMKTISNRSGATVNDVMVSCVAGALKKYFCKTNAVPVSDVHCVVPVSMQSQSEEVGFKNDISVHLLPFSLSEKTALERLESTRQIICKAKNSPNYVLHYNLIKLIMNRLPNQITRHIFRLIDITCYITNVPMQQSQCFNVYDQEVMVCNLLPPLDGSASLSFLISSFKGYVQLSVSIDKTIVEKKYVDFIIESIKEEFQELEKSCENVIKIT
uniref:Uncharacterized protein n=1 Tax=Strigamia maritima TaxID=126957 RepID=T1JC51_STRMM